MRKYNGLNAVKVDLAAIGICEACGRRFTDPLCTHATRDQIEYTAKMDAEIDAEYDRKRTLNELIHRPTEIETTAQECERIQAWFSENWEYIPEIPFGAGV